jgi:hypothetical protein
MVFVKVPKRHLKKGQEPIRFRVEATRPDGLVVESERTSVFVGPDR